MPGRPATQHIRSFADLSPGQFEALVRQLMGSLPDVVWEIRPDPIGHLGSDLGRDFRSIERYTTRTGRQYKRLWVGQAKRVQAIYPSSVRQIVNEALPIGAPVPHALVVAVGCNASRRTYDEFQKQVAGARYLT